MPRIIPFILLPLLLLAAAGALPLKAADTSAGQTVYVPIYSHIYSGDRERPYLLTAILSIRNIDLKQPITIMRVDYHDTAGKLVRKYLEKPVELGPLATIRYVVGESDKSGGSGAKFLVYWEAAKKAHSPVIQGVMIGTQMQQGISFVTDGIVLEDRRP